MNINIYKKSKIWDRLKSNIIQINEKDNIVEFIFLNEKNQYQQEIYEKDEIDLIITIGITNEKTN